MCGKELFCAIGAARFLLGKLIERANVQSRKGVGPARAVAPVIKVSLAPVIKVAAPEASTVGVVITEEDVVAQEHYFVQRSTTTLFCTILFCTRE